MSDFTSSNTSCGGIYERGYTLDETENHSDVYIMDKCDSDDLVEAITFSDDEEILLKLDIVNTNDSVSGVKSVTGVQIAFPKDERHKLSKYLREVADMLDRKG